MAASSQRTRETAGVGGAAGFDRYPAGESALALTVEGRGLISWDFGPGTLSP